MAVHSNITRLHPVVRPHDTSFEGVVRTQLDRLLHSAQFDASTRSREFLRFVVDEALGGRGSGLTQATIAVTVFGRGDDFDPLLDPIVRVQAGRLRRSLERYYLLSDVSEAVRIELPKGRYAPVFVTVAAQEAATQSSRQPMRADIEPDWPTIVIHPFVVSQPDDDYAAARLTDELTMELHRYGDVRVVRQRDMDPLDSRPQAGVRFELRAAFHHDADDSLLMARLVDRASAEEVWSDEYRTDSTSGSPTGGIDDVARVLAARIGSEHGIIVRLLAGDSHSRSAATGNAFGAILRCHRFLLTHQLDELLPSIESLQQVAEREPQLASVWMHLARLYLLNHAFELTELQTPIDKAVEYASQAVAIDPGSARIRCTLAAAMLVKGELGAARDELGQALRLNSSALAHREIIGWLLALAGDWDRGMALLRDAMARNPYCHAHARHGLWADHLRRGEYDAAYRAALEYRDSGYFWRTLMTTCCLGHIGRVSDAREGAAALLRLKPQFIERGRTLIGNYIKPAELRECIHDGLSRAGLSLL